MTANVYLDSGDSLDIKAFPVDGRVSIWAGGLTESPDVVVHSRLPFHLYTEPRACTRDHRDGRAIGWTALGLGWCVGVLTCATVLAVAAWALP